MITFGYLYSILLQLLADFLLMIHTGEIYIFLAAGLQVTGIIKLVRVVSKVIQNRSFNKELTELLKCSILIALGLLVQLLT